MGINPFLIVGTDNRHRSFEGHTHNRNRNTNTKEREERGERGRGRTGEGNGGKTDTEGRAGWRRRPGARAERESARAKERRTNEKVARRGGERQRELEEPECVVCMDKERSHIFVPCGHRCVCEECSAMVMRAAQPRCPYCRAPATSSIRTFL